MTARTGAVFLLQEKEPTRLIGSVFSTVPASGPCLVCVSFSPEMNVISLRQGDDQVSLVLSWSLALALIGYVQVSVARAIVLRGSGAGPHAAAQFCSGAIFVNAERIKIDEKRSRRMLVCSWAADLDGIEYKIDGDEVELLLREDLASTLALEIIEALARIEPEQ